LKNCCCHATLANLAFGLPVKSGLLIEIKFAGNRMIQNWPFDEANQVVLGRTGPPNFEGLK
jgi:hypothetical protein